MLNCRAMNATTPDRETAPPRRVSLVLHPRRDVQHAIDQVTAWAQRTGTELAAVDDGRLPAEVRRCEIGELAHGCDLVLALGGDGTMLGGLRLAAPLGVPVLGANLGRLGYLTEVDGEHLPEALEALAAGAYGVEERFVLRAAWKEDGQEREQVAFNDVVLSRVPGRGQALLALRVDGQLLVRYASDGVIAATPIGSTAYSYAAGGPIVSPQTRAMIITPDAPHGLFNRAVVLGAEEMPGRRHPPVERADRGRGRRAAARGGRAGLERRDQPEPVARAVRAPGLRRASPSAHGASSASPTPPRWPTSTSQGTSDDRARSGRRRHRRGLRAGARGHARAAGRRLPRGPGRAPRGRAARDARGRRAGPRDRRPHRRRRPRCGRRPVRSRARRVRARRRAVQQRRRRSGGRRRSTRSPSRTGRRSWRRTSPASSCARRRPTA